VDPGIYPGVLVRDLADRALALRALDVVVVDHEAGDAQPFEERSAEGERPDRAAHLEGLLVVHFRPARSTSPALTSTSPAISIIGSRSASRPTSPARRAAARRSPAARRSASSMRTASTTSTTGSLTDRGCASACSRRPTWTTPRASTATGSRG